MRDNWKLFRLLSLFSFLNCLVFGFEVGIFQRVLGVCCQHEILWTWPRICWTSDSDKKKVGLKKMLRSPFLCIMCIRVEKTSTNHGRLVPTKWLKKTLQKCSFLKTFNWWCVHILGCAWARASNIHTSKQAYSLARKLDVLWLRHEWIYVLETKLLRTTTSYSHLAAFEMGIPAPLGTARVYH